VGIGPVCAGKVKMRGTNGIICSFPLSTIYKCRATIARPLRYPLSPQRVRLSLAEGVGGVPKTSYTTDPACQSGEQSRAAAAKSCEAIGPIECPEACSVRLALPQSA
jgi:hypothetical protein